MDQLGNLYLDNVFNGYNCSLLAYGQTGSGKSYTMTGTPEDAGIVPRGCEALFERIAANTDKCVRYEVAVGFLEIYNEQVRDLLNPAAKAGQGGTSAKLTSAVAEPLKVREIPGSGFYVQGLTKRQVANYSDVEGWMTVGNKHRSIASTAMNATSSRSHSIFVIYFTKKTFSSEEQKDDDVSVCTSEVNLVDLAGSERSLKTGATGQTLKEANAINQSLTTLGNVISALADLQKKGGAAGKTADFVPYRNSVLTKLLKSSLGGDAKTIMVAAVSPSWDNMEETLSTLRYAWRVKSIKTRAVKNEARSRKEIDAAFNELKRLKDLISSGQATDDINAEFHFLKDEWTMLESDLVDRLQGSRGALAELTKALDDSGISFEELGTAFSLSINTPYFVNIGPNVSSPDEPLIYFLLSEHTTIGSKREGADTDILLDGGDLLQLHVTISKSDEKVTMVPQKGATVKHNGKPLTQAVDLTPGDRIILGKHVLWRYGRNSAEEPDTVFTKNTDQPAHTLRRLETARDFQAELEALEKKIAKGSKTCTIL